MSKSTGNSGVPFLYSVNRRVFLAQSAALAASTLLPSCGGGGGGSSNPSTPNNPTPLSIISISPTNPTALTPIAVQLSGFDPTKPFTVAFGGQSQTPIRVDSSSGAIIIAAPANIDATTGATASLSTNLSVSQNGNTASSPIQISDMPQLSDLGVPLGTISRAFLNYQAIVLGQSINAQQAISLLPKAGNPNNATLLANLKLQLLNVILARNDIDRVVSNNTVSIPIGTTPTAGLPLSFDVNSVTMMDRVLAQYLLAGTNNGTIVPQVKTSRRYKHGLKVNFLASGGSAFWTTLTQAINTESGAVSYLSNLQTQAAKDSSTFDRLLSTVSAYSSYVTAGATLLSLAAGATAAAPILAGAATLAAITGFVCGSLAMGNDYYNLFTSVYALASNQPGASAANIESAFASLAADGVTTYLNAEGLGGLLGANASVSPGLLNSIYTDIFKATADSATLGAAQLAVSTDNLLAQQIISADSNTAASSIQSVSPSDFGLVTGMCTISNSQGPILSGLSGVGAGDNGSAPDALTSIAAPDGSYELVLPLGSPDLTYNAMDAVAFDPVDLYDPSINTLTVLDSSVVDLSGINPNTPITGPSFVGTCNDTDAGTPDADDPDCD